MNKIIICRQCNLQKEQATPSSGRLCKSCASKRMSEWAKTHRKRRQLRSNYINRTRKQYYVELFGGKCVDCQGVYPYCVYDFDHIKGIKLYNPSKAISYGGTLAEEELRKCDLVCSNCHRIRTFIKRKKHDK